MRPVKYETIPRVPVPLLFNDAVAVSKCATHNTFDRAVAIFPIGQNVQDLHYIIQIHGRNYNFRADRPVSFNIRISNDRILI